MGNRILWRLVDDRLEAVVGRRTVATVWENGTWFTWIDSYGTGGENDRESNVIRAIQEAEKAIRRMGLDE